MTFSPVFVSLNLTHSHWFYLFLILLSSRGLTIFKFIAILVAVLLTSAAKMYPPPPHCFLSSPSPLSSEVFEVLILYFIYLFIHVLFLFVFFTFNDFFHSAELREWFLTQQIINSLLLLEDITCQINFCNIPVGHFFSLFICGNSYFLIVRASAW